jgi:hypothetical protein
MVAVIPVEPTLRVQRRMLPEDLPAPEELAFDMHLQAPMRIAPSDPLPGESD